MVPFLVWMGVVSGTYILDGGCGGENDGARNVLGFVVPAVRGNEKDDYE